MESILSCSSFILVISFQISISVLILYDCYWLMVELFQRNFHVGCGIFITQGLSLVQGPSLWYLCVQEMGLYYDPIMLVKYTCNVTFLIVDFFQFIHCAS